LEHIGIVVKDSGPSCPAKDFPLAGYRTNIQFVHQPQDRFVVDANSFLILKSQGDAPISVYPMGFLTRLLYLFDSFQIWIGLI